MDIRLRRVYYIFFILLFFVLTPLLVLYGMGWRYQWNSGKFLRTGVISVRSYPVGAQVFVDGSLSPELTPAVVRDLFPGMHTVEVRKEGFDTWNKNFSVEAGAATLAEHVVLFDSAKSPSILSEAKVLLSSVSPDHKSFVFIDKNNLVWFAPTSGDVLEKLVSLGHVTGDASLFRVTWSPFVKGQFLLYQPDSLTRYFFDAGERRFFFFTNNAHRFLRAEWSEKNSFVFIDAENRQLFRYDLSDRSTSPVFEGVVWDVQRIFDRIHMVATLAEKTGLFSLQGRDAEMNYALSGEGADYAFGESRDQVFSLIDGKKSLLLFSWQYTAQELRRSVDFTSLSLDARAFLYGNDHELWSFDMKDNQETTILRSSDTISGVSWDGTAGYVFLGFPDRVEVRELDMRDHVNTSLLWRDGGRNFFTDADGKNLFFVGENDGKIKYLKVL